MSIEKIPKIGAVEKVHNVARMPKQTRRFAILEVDEQSDTEKLEASIEHGYPGSLAEKLVIQWAIDNELIFQVQWQLFSSRTMWRSTLVDVVVFMYEGIPQTLAIRVQSFWHMSPGRRYHDDVQAGDLRAAGYRVVDVWDEEIQRAALNDNLDRYMDDAIYDPLYV